MNTFKINNVIATDQLSSYKAQNASLVGYSLSLCVSDILNDKVNESQVTCIIAGTSFHPSDLEQILNSYALSYWSKNPEEGKAIARRLHAAGKIEQPARKRMAIPYISDGHWAPAN